MVLVDIIEETSTVLERRLEGTWQRHTEVSDVDDIRTIFLTYYCGHRRLSSKAAVLAETSFSETPGKWHAAP